MHSLLNFVKKLIGYESQYIEELSSDDEDDYEHNPQHENPELLDSTADVEENKKHEPTSNEFAISNETATDAALKMHKKIVLTTDRVRAICKQLEDYEIVSLVYLIFDDAYYALQELCLYLQDPHKEILYQWAVQSSSTSKDWSAVFIEALCILQNYQVLKQLGETKPELITRFMPHRPSAVLNINETKKALYLMCENFDLNDTDRFLNHARKSLEAINKPYVEYDRRFLELYLLHWQTVGFISMLEIKNVLSIVKTMDKDVLYHDLQAVSSVRHENNTVVNDKLVSNIAIETKPSTSKLRQISMTCDNNIIHNNSQPQSLPSDSQYWIAPEKPGVVLIINQEDFHMEINKNYKHLLTPVTDGLETRTGTTQDRKNLCNLFAYFKFKVFVEDNMTHDTILPKIEEIANQITDESSFFVIILSHGDRGVIYGANSCKVHVADIQKVMCKTNRTNLAGKAKVLILQACQGERCQTIEGEDFLNNDINITTDGGNSASNRLPDTVDLLTFWASVPGFAAIRNKKEGSWFIKAFCEKVVEYHKQWHLLDICTEVVNGVTERKWYYNAKTNTMTPLLSSTLRKKFYFPQQNINN